VGLVGNCADVIPELARRGIVPDILRTDLRPRSAQRYVPGGMSLQDALRLRQSDPQSYQERSLDSIARSCGRHVSLQQMGSVTFDYGNNIRTFAFQRGVKNAYDFPGFGAISLMQCFTAINVTIRHTSIRGGLERFSQLESNPNDTFETSDRASEPPPPTLESLKTLPGSLHAHGRRLPADQRVRTRRGWLLARNNGQVGLFQREGEIPDERVICRTRNSSRLRDAKCCPAIVAGAPEWRPEPSRLRAFVGIEEERPHRYRRESHRDPHEGGIRHRRILQRCPPQLSGRRRQFKRCYQHVFNPA